MSSTAKFSLPLSDANALFLLTQPPPALHLRKAAFSESLGRKVIVTKAVSQLSGVSTVEYHQASRQEVAERAELLQQRLDKMIINQSGRKGLQETQPQYLL